MKGVFTAVVDYLRKKTIIVLQWYLLFDILLKSYVNLFSETIIRNRYEVCS